MKPINYKALGAKIKEYRKKENITHYYSISDEDAITMSKMLAKELGLGVGISSGANF